MTAVLLWLVLLCACADHTVTAEVPPTAVQNQVLVPAQNGIPFAAIGSILPGGSLVTAYSADSTCYYSAFNFEDGQKAVEFTYDAPTGNVIFRTDYTYENGMLQAVVSQATAESGYGYTFANGTSTACKKIETLYADGREVLLQYTDFAGNCVAKAVTRYAADGSRVYILQENGVLRLLRTYSRDGAQLFSSEYGLGVGSMINFGSFGTAAVVSVGADGSRTLQFADRSHRMSDGTLYDGLDLFVVVNAAFDTAAAVYSKNGTKVGEYRTVFQPDGSVRYDYYEYATPVCSLYFDRTGVLTQKKSAGSGDYFASDAVTVGMQFGGGSVCDQNADGSFTVVYFNRGYLHTDGSFSADTTLYAFFDADRRLAGNKYYVDGKVIATCDFTYQTDGSFSVQVTEGETIVYRYSDGSTVR